MVQNFLDNFAVVVTSSYDLDPVTANSSHIIHIQFERKYQLENLAIIRDVIIK